MSITGRGCWIWRIICTGRSCSRWFRQFAARFALYWIMRWILSQIFLRKTIYKDSPQPQELLEGNAVTYRLGSFVNGVVGILNKTAWRERPDEKDYTHQYALAYTSFKENTSLIGRSLSYGLILFCVGLLATLVYLLLVLAG